MTLDGWIQVALFGAIVLALVKPLGLYMTRVFTGGPTLLSPVLAPFERGLYRLTGIDARQEQGWLGYGLALLVFKALGFVLLYGRLRLQAVLPLNPAGQAAVAPDLAFNTAVSFVTNTNWQNYGGETTLPHLSQMLGLTTQNFLSAATGFALALALIRGFAHASVGTVGSFWVDLTRATLYVLRLLQRQRRPPVRGPDGARQPRPNGDDLRGGCNTHQRVRPVVGDERQGWAILAAMGVLFLVGVAVTYAAEAAGSPVLNALGLSGATWRARRSASGFPPPPCSPG